MKIDSNRPVGTTGIRKDGKRTSSSGFADNLRGQEEVESAAVSSTPLLSDVDALFSLQEVGDGTGEKRRAVLRADEMLDRLEDLKRGLLIGSIGLDKLTELARLAKEGAVTVEDPKIRDILGEIELRARVELAKLDPQIND